MCTLQAIIQNSSSSSNLPNPLPIFHVTLGNSFEQIINSRGLIPTSCQVFGENILYFSYGIASYRPSQDNARNTTDYPIIFVFHPNLLRDIDTYFPYDTGAAHYHKYGEEWSEELTQFGKYRVESNGNLETPCQLISHIYQNNQRYLNANVVQQQSISTTDHPLSTIVTFLTSDLSSICDHRQHTIECQTTRNFVFDNNLMWVGLPDTQDYMQGVDRLFDMISPHRPRIYFYSIQMASSRNPREYTFYLGNQAQQELEQYYRERYTQPRPLGFLKDFLKSIQGKTWSWSRFW